jgi:Big-like domain-containing protein
MFSVFMIPRWRLAALTLLPALFLLAETACQRVPLLAPSGSVITLTSSATVLPFNGSTLIQAQVIEAAGTPPHSGTHVTFTTTLGTIQPSDGETDSSGIVKVTFLAGGQSGTATITAISGGASVSATGAVKILVGSAAVGRVNMSANPGTVPAVGGTSTITANVLDINGNTLPNVPVTFAATTGTLSATVVNTDANGNAQTSLTTATQSTVTGSVGAQGSTTPPATGGGGGTGGTTPTTPTSGQASGSVTVGINSAPTLVITPPTTPPTAGIAASFTFAVTVATSNGSAIRDLTVDWGDPSPDVQDLGAVTGNAVVTHVFPTAGTFTVTATLVDAAGNRVSVSTVVFVQAAAPLGVSITFTQTVVNNANTLVTFTATVTGLGNAVVTQYLWDFGDVGSTPVVTTTNQVTHQYAHPSNPPTVVASVKVTTSAATNNSTSATTQLTP